MHWNSRNMNTEVSTWFHLPENFETQFGGWKNVKRFTGQLYQQSNRKWSVRPALLSPNWTWISFPWKSGFLSFVGSDFLQPGILRRYWAGAGFNEKSKDQMLQAGLQSSQPAPYLDVWEEFYVQLQIRRFPDCVMSPPKLATPLTADIQYRSLLKV